MEKIFITGATGFVGSNLIRRLVEEGKEVTAFIMKDLEHPFLHNLKIRKGNRDVFYNLVSIFHVSLYSPK